MFNKKDNWKEIIASYKNNPRDVKTIPKKGEGVWFYVYEYNNDIYIESGKNHINSSNIEGRRRLEKEKLDAMLSLYYRRKKGESISQEAKEITYNQVYWYGIFSDLNI